MLTLTKKYTSHFIAVCMLMLGGALSAQASELVIMKQNDRLKPSSSDQILGKIGSRIVVLQSDSNVCIYDTANGQKRYIWGFDQLPGWMEKGYQKTSEIWLAPNDLVVYAGGTNLAYSAITADKLPAFGGNASPIEMVFDGNSIAIRKVNNKSQVLWVKPFGHWNAAADMNNANPNGVWSYGGGTVGGDFVKYQIIANNKGLWHHGPEGWKGVYFNNTGAPQTLSGGLNPAPGTLIIHPGNGADHLSKIRFTAPKDGRYAVNANFKNIDQQAKKTFNWVYTNASSENGKVYSFTPAGWKELYGQEISGVNASSVFNRVVTLKAGEMLSFEVGNGGDTYTDDSVQVDIQINVQ